MPMQFPYHTIAISCVSFANYSLKTTLRIVNNSVVNFIRKIAYGNLSNYIDYLPTIRHCQLGGSRSVGRDAGNTLPERNKNLGVSGPDVRPTDHYTEPQQYRVNVYECHVIYLNLQTTRLLNSFTSKMGRSKLL